MMGPGCWWGTGSFFGHPLGMLFGVVFWLLVLYGLFVIISNVAKRGSGPGQNEMPLDILKKRYARGEVNAEEFVRMKKDMES